MSSSKSSSDKHKSVSEARKAESSTSVAGGVTLDRSSEKKTKLKEDRNKSVENRLLMLAMESDTKPDTSGRVVGRARSPVKSKRERSPSLPPPPLQGKGKDMRKDHTSPSLITKDARKERVELPAVKSKKVAKERSISPTRSRDVRRDRSVSPSRPKDRGAKSSHNKSQGLQLPGPGRASEKLKPSSVEEKPLDQLEKREGGSQKLEKVKASRKRRRSSTSSASSSSSSSSGSDSGSSSGSSSSGSSSSSSGSSDESSDDRKPMKDRRGKDAKLLAATGRQSDAKPIRPDADAKGPAKGANRSKKDKERNPLDESHARRPGSEKDKSRTLESTKHGHGKKDPLSPAGRGSRKKDWEKGDLRRGQDSGLDSRSSAKADVDKASRDSQDRSATGELSRQKTVDATVEYTRKARSPTAKDDRGKPMTPADLSRRGQSPAESLRSHHSTKPLQDPERDLEGQSGQYPRDYYSSREKPVRKDDDRYQQYDDQYAKKLPDARSQGYSSHKHHSSDPYERSREPADLDRDDRDGRYSRDHGYEADRYALPTDRHHPG